MSDKKVQKRPDPVFLTSAASINDFPDPSGEEYAILGRSNVGKSSFVNHILERRGLAKTSRKPGKTSLANFFRIDPAMVWVDLPGYGYAKTSRSEKERWSGLIRDYCEWRENLAGILWLVDIRHPGVKTDLEARQWLERLGYPFFTILTKTDKLSRQKVAQQTRAAMKQLRLPEEPVGYSIVRHASRAEFWKRFEQWRKKMDR